MQLSVNQYQNSRQNKLLKKQIWIASRVRFQMTQDSNLTCNLEGKIGKNLYFFVHCYINHIVYSRRFGLLKFALSLFTKLHRSFCQHPLHAFWPSLQAAAFCLRLVQLGPRAFQHGTSGETNNLKKVVLKITRVLLSANLFLSLYIIPQIISALQSKNTVCALTKHSRYFH